MADPTLYGWTSARMRASGVGTVVYLRADGHEVEVDTVSSTPDNSGTSWGDEICVGVVTRCVRPRQPQHLVFSVGTDSWRGLIG